MKQLLILFAFACLTYVAKGQNLPALGFETSESTEAEPKDKDNKISLRVFAQGGDAASYPVKFKVKRNGGSADPTDFEIDESAEHTINKAGESVLVWVTLKSDSKKEADETIRIEIVPDAKFTLDAKPSHEITLTEVPNTSEIRLTTGVDFDFQTNENPTSFFGSLNGFIPNAFGDGSGFAFEIFSNQFTGLDTLNSTVNLTFPVGNPYTEDGSTFYNVQQTSLNPTKLTTTRNYGVSFSPIFKLKEGKNAGVYFGMIGEFMLSRTNISFTYDTLRSSVEQFSETDFANLEINSRTPILSQSDLLVSTIGLTMPIRYTSDEYEVRIALNAGATARTPRVSGGVSVTYFQPYGEIDINVMDRKFGITIGAEARTSVVQNVPFVNLYLAKSFNFSKFASYE